MLRIAEGSPRQWLAFVVALMAPLAQACATPPRVPLGAPFPLVRGGTSIPAEGVAAGVELNDGLQGQELLRKELLAGSITFGLENRLAFSLGAYAGHDENDEPTGFLASAKVRLGSWLGERTSTAARLGYTHINRVKAGDGDGQDESLRTVDLALPTEFLLSAPESSVRFSGYAGPRFLYEDYRDELVPEDQFTGFVPGLLAGLHLDFGAIHVFGEGTLAWRPDTTFRGEAFPGGSIFLPAVGVIVRSGPAFPWD
ncbi:MAG: hypothetical protein ACODAA_02400 [Gemmatimonadota bacterium]